MNSYTLLIQMDLHGTADLLLALFGKSPSQLLLEIRPLPISVRRRERCFFPLMLLQKTGFDRTIPIHLDSKSKGKPEELHKIEYFGQSEARTTLEDAPII